AVAKKRGEDGDHHSGGGGVRHEQREQRGDEDDAEKDDGRAFSEREEKRFGEADIEAVFGGGESENESAEEENEDGSGDWIDKDLVESVGSGGDRASGASENVDLENDDQNRGGERRNGLGHPKSGGTDKDGEHDALRFGEFRNRQERGTESDGEDDAEFE